MSLDQKYFDSYYEAVKDTDRDKALSSVEDAIKDGVQPEEIVFEIVVPAIESMLKEFTVDESTTLSQHFIASKLAEEVTAKMFPLFKTAPEEQGTVIIGTSFGDFHGLGKKIVGGCLKANMFNVIDVGLNVKPENFVDTAVEHQSTIIGISSMMVHTATGEKGAKGVRGILRERGLESEIKLVVGGAPYRFHDELYKEVEADGWAETGIEAVSIIKKLQKGV
jgi:trimethylamine corrinoid protein